jgi:hypothetical protein
MNYNRFDHEQSILAAWGILDQIDSVLEGVLDYGWTPDQTANALMGIKEIYELKFDKLFNEFENGVHERKII